MTVARALTFKLDDEITIRRAETVADYRACQEAQRRAWGISDEGYVIPIATMVGANLHGGLVMGAFLDRGDAVALSFAFLGRTEARLCLYSQLTGVVPGYQSRGLGFRIKQLQREFARAEGIDLIVWAFDPLQAGNAHFNLARLGATAHRYIDNMYGERSDALNAGVPTDRLIAEWETSDRPNLEASVEEIRGLPRLIDVGQGGLGGRDSNSGGMLPTFAGMPPISRRRVLLEIPDDIGHLRREAPDLAERWRVAVNQAFGAAFAAGYRAVSLVREESAAGRRACYVLEMRGC
jgi:predicted GNAT superfamily acetyltransferase